MAFSTDNIGKNCYINISEDENIEDSLYGTIIGYYKDTDKNEEYYFVSINGNVIKIYDDSLVSIVDDCSSVTPGTLIMVSGEMTESQAAQFRENIGAVSTDDIGTIFVLKGSVATVEDLPTTGNNIGDVYYVETVSAGYIWLTSASQPNGYWEELGETFNVTVDSELSETSENPVQNKVITSKINQIDLQLEELYTVVKDNTLTSFRELQRLTRLGLASKVLAVGDQIVCERATATTATVGNSAGTPGITAATVDRDTFIHAIGTSHNGDYEFYWDGAVWHYQNEAVELSTYGITLTGTPAIGDKIVVHETADSLVWDVLGIDCDTPADSQFTHSVTLGLHDCFVELQFDPREALFYCEEGLAAGTYNFTVKQHAWVSSDVNKTFQFTLTQAIPAKGQLVLQVAYNVTIAGSTAKTYSSSTSTTEIETVTITEGSGGTSLGDVNNAISGGTNSLSRGLLGNNRYSQSAMRQYLNSKAAAGIVWTPKNVWDRAPSWATTTAGFLNGMDEDFLAVIGEVTKRTALNTVSDGGGYEDTAEKFFLLSSPEVYGGNEGTGGEGAAYPYYANRSDLGAPGTGNDSNRIKYRNGAAKHWWLRSPTAGYAGLVRGVYTTGGVRGNGASNSYGVAPACCIL